MMQQLTREELFELIWSSPVSKVASTLGLSDVGLAKRCKRDPRRPPIDSQNMNTICPRPEKKGEASIFRQTKSNDSRYFGQNRRYYQFE
jgi:hypothetical protein